MIILLFPSPINEYIESKHSQRKYTENEALVPYTVSMIDFRIQSISRILEKIYWLGTCPFKSIVTFVLVFSKKMFIIM